jgi:hypothetical protein
MNRVAGQYVLRTREYVKLSSRQSHWSDNGNMADGETIRWARTWKEFAPELEAIRLREVRDQDNLLSLRLLARAFNHATRTQPPGGSSGLVEMQRHLAKLRR